MEISAEHCNFDTSMCRTSGRNEAMNSGQLEGRERRGRVEIEENSRLGLGLLCNGDRVNNFRGSCGVRRTGDGGNGMSKLQCVQGLVQCLVEVRNGNF